MHSIFSEIDIRVVTADYLYTHVNKVDPYKDLTNNTLEQILQNGVYKKNCL